MKDAVAKTIFTSSIYQAKVQVELFKKYFSIPGMAESIIEDGNTPLEE